MKRSIRSAAGQSIDYRVEHRPRVTRRIHLEIDGNGGLRVVAPKRMSMRAIQSALQQKVHHVERFLEKSRRRQKEVPAYRYVDGEQHLYMGRSFSLSIRLSSDRKPSVEISKDTLNVLTPRSNVDGIRAALVRWYRQQAGSHFSERLAEFAGAAPWTGGKIPPVRLRLMKKTWGSCSAKGVITLNPHLVKAPPSCIDYVIAHEICHLQEHNHQKAFYALQQQIYPDWRSARNHLRSRGHIYLNM